MVLGGQPPGRVGRRRITFERPRESGAFLFDAEGAPAEQAAVLCAREIAEARPDEPDVLSRAQQHSLSVVRPRVVQLEPRPARPGAQDLVTVAEELDVVVRRLRRASPGQPGAVETTSPAAGEKSPTCRAFRTSLTLTVNEARATFCPRSVAVQSTLVTPTRNSVDDAGEQTGTIAPSTRSVADTPNLTTAPFLFAVRAFTDAGTTSRGAVRSSDRDPEALRSRSRPDDPAPCT